MTFERLRRALFLYPKLEVTKMTVRKLKPSKEALELKVRIWANRLTQRQVADAVGITEQAMSEYLLGRRLLKRQELEAVEAYLTEVEESPNVCER